MKASQPIVTLAAALLTGVVWAQGCGPAGSGEHTDAVDPAVDAHEERVLYTVRGRIVSLPDPDNPASELMVHHEPIPAFRRGDGGFGMDAMTMPFPLAPQASVPADLKVGDAVEMTFSVLYDRDTGRIQGYAVEKLVKLPPATTLVFEASDPEAKTGAPR